MLRTGAQPKYWTHYPTAYGHRCSRIQVTGVRPPPDLQSIDSRWRRSTNPCGVTVGTIGTIATRDSIAIVSRAHARSIIPFAAAGGAPFPGSRRDMQSTDR